MVDGTRELVLDVELDFEQQADGCGECNLISPYQYKTTWLSSLDADQEQYFSSYQLESHHRVAPW